MRKEFTFTTEVLKVSAELGIVFGWAVICSKNEERYFDLQDDHATEQAIIKGALDFMLHSRKAKEMHWRSDAGEIPLAWPLTADVKKAFGIQCDKTGLMIAMKPDTEMFEKFKSGELTGFSIGGYCDEYEYIEEE